MLGKFGTQVNTFNRVALSELNGFKARISSFFCTISTESTLCRIEVVLILWILNLRNTYKLNFK